jgi:hypothetical protein
MIKNLFIYVALGFPSLAISNTLAMQSLWSQHCQQVATDPGLFLKKLIKSENRLSFNNHGGLLNGGVCWWHSRLTRTSQYLAVFNPDEKPLSELEAYSQVKRLRSGKPTTFNGYKNLYEFSIAHPNAIQKNLEEWQVSNGGFQLGFLDGLTGTTTLPAVEMKILMDKTFQQMKLQRPLFQVLQLPGITAHAWLITGIQQTDKGYRFQVVDSNYSQIQTWNYQYGDSGFSYGRLPFVNYTTYRGILEEESLSRRLTEVCLNINRPGSQTYFDSWVDIDTELDAKTNNASSN